MGALAWVGASGTAEAKRKKKKSCPTATVSYIPVRLVRTVTTQTVKGAEVQQQAVEVQQMAAPAKASAEVQQQAAPAKSSVEVQQQAAPAVQQRSK